MLKSVFKLEWGQTGNMSETGHVQGERGMPFKLCSFTSAAVSPRHEACRNVGCCCQAFWECRRNTLRPPDFYGNLWIFAWASLANNLLGVFPYYLLIGLFNLGVGGSWDSRGLMSLLSFAPAALLTAEGRKQMQGRGAFMPACQILARKLSHEETSLKPLFHFLSL